MKRIIVGVSGASAASLAVRVLRLLRATPGVETHLILSRAAELTLRLENKLSVSDIAPLADTVYTNDNFGAAPASGTFAADGMIVVPCSMKTLAGIASGYSDSLLLRAADVTIKEGRRLILAVRESPLSAVHLENMLKLARIPGIRLMPPLINGYQQAKTLEDLEIQIAARYLDALGIDTPVLKRWSGCDGMKKSPVAAA